MARVEQVHRAAKRKNFPTPGMALDYALDKLSGGADRNIFTWR